MKVNKVNFQEFENNEKIKTNNITNIDRVKDIPLELNVVLGTTTMTIKEITNIKIGSVIELDKLVGEFADICIKDKIIAKGEIVVVDEFYGIKITEIVKRV